MLNRVLFVVLLSGAMFGGSAVAAEPSLWLNRVVAESDARASTVHFRNGEVVELAFNFRLVTPEGVLEGKEAARALRPGMEISVPAYPPQNAQQLPTIKQMRLNTQ